MGKHQQGQCSFSNISSPYPNCTYKITLTQLIIESNLGQDYILPLPSHFHSLTPLFEGLLITTHEYPKFNYYHLSKHPYNSLLNIIELKAGLVYVSQTIPLWIFYDSVIQSHSMYIVKLFEEECPFEEKLYLDGGGQGEQGPILEKIFEECQQDDPVIQGVEVKGSPGEVILALNMGDYVKIYSLNFVIEGQSWQVQGIRVLGDINGVDGVFSCELQQDHQRIIQYKEKVIKRDLNPIFDYKQLLGNLKHTHLLFTYKNGQIQIFSGKDKLLHYRHTQLLNLSSSPQSIQVQDGQATVEFIEENESIKVSSNPVIQEPLICYILESIKHVVPEIHQQLLVDTIKNCLTHSDFTYLDDSSQVSRLSNEYQNFLYLIIYILKFCKRNGYNSKKDFSYSPVIEKKSLSSRESIQVQTQEDKMLSMIQENKEFQDQMDFLKDCDINFSNAQPQLNEIKLPIITISLEKFNENKIKIFRILHLLYQDLKLDKLQIQNRQELCYLLFCFSQYLDHEFSIVYQDYYLRENPSIVQRFHNDQRIKKIEIALQELKFDNKGQDSSFLINIQKDQFLERNPPDIYDWLARTMNDSLFQKMPLSFKLSKTLCTFIDILYQQEGTYISDLIRDKAQFTITQISKVIGKENNLPFFTPVNRIKNKKINLPDPKEKAFYYLIKKKIDLQKIEDFPFSFQMIIYELLRSFRNQIPIFLIDCEFQKEAFELINRKDMLKNLQLNVHQIDDELQKSINNIIHGSMDSEEYHEQKLNVTKKNQDLILKEIRYDQECQKQLYNYCIRRLSCFVGHGALYYGIQKTFVTEPMQIQKINLNAIMPPDNLRLTLDTKDEKYQNIKNWPSFNNGVATALQLSKSFKFVSPSHLRTWILYQRPEQPTHEHGGFLYGLGLLGHLNPFLPSDIYLYLKQNHETTSVGVLLGLACSKIGKVVDDGTYKTFCLHINYLLPQNYDIEIPLVQQTAALVGFGLLYKQSSNRLMSEMTLAQIGAKSEDKPQDRESYSLAAGFALGLINLSKGSNQPSIRDLNLTKRLLILINGGSPVTAPRFFPSSHMTNQKNYSSIREKGINLHMTSNGALVALALIHFNSNDTYLMSQIELPNTRHAYFHGFHENVQLKVICRGLIGWSLIGDDRNWLNKQICQWVKSSRGAGEGGEKIYWNWVVGLVLLMALRWSGTGHKGVIQMVIDIIQEMRGLKVVSLDKLNHPNQGNLIDANTLNQNLCSLCLALGLINAGSCDINSVKICRVIRKKIQDSGHYGWNLAINMALGFLSLGNGGYSFKNTDFSIACLLISIYPYYPTNPEDNKDHLQALRNFYILAIEHRELRTIDVDQNENVNLTLDLISEQETISQVTPMLIRDQTKLKQSNYFQVSSIT